MEKKDILDSRGIPKAALIGTNGLGMMAAQVMLLTNYTNPKNIPRGFIKALEERKTEAKSRPEPVSEIDRQFSLNQHRKQKTYKNRRRKK